MATAGRVVPHHAVTTNRCEQGGAALQLLLSDRELENIVMNEYASSGMDPIFTLWTSNDSICNIYLFPFLDPRTRCDHNWANLGGRRRLRPQVSRVPPQVTKYEAGPGLAGSALSSLPLYHGEQFDFPLDTRGNKDKEHCYRPVLQNLPLQWVSSCGFFSTVKTSDCFYLTI